MKNSIDRWVLLGITFLSFINTWVSIPNSNFRHQRKNSYYIVKINRLFFETGTHQRYLAVATPLRKRKSNTFNLLESLEKFRGDDVNIQVIFKKNNESVKRRFPQISIQNSYLIKGNLVSVLQPNRKINSFDYYVLSKNIFASLYPSYITLLSLEQSQHWFDSFSDKLNFRLNTIRWGNEETTNNFFYSVLWGKKTKLDKTLKSLFRELGLSHILVVSGFHVGLIFLFIHLIFICFRPLVHSRLLFVIIQIVVLSVYAFVICGGSPSVTRATIMLCLAIIGLSFGRKVSGYHILGSTTFLILISNPLWLLDIGFILSFSAVLGIFIALEISHLHIESSHKLLNETFALKEDIFSIYMIDIQLIVVYLLCEKTALQIFKSPTNEFRRHLC